MIASATFIVHRDASVERCCHAKADIGHIDAPAKDLACPKNLLPPRLPPSLETERLTGYVGQQGFVPLKRRSENHYESYTADGELTSLGRTCCTSGRRRYHFAQHGTTTLAFPCL
jgi:hypothetical protein